MSKIGGKEIKIPDGVTVTQQGKVLAVKGKLGAVNVPLLDMITVTIDGGVIKFAAENERKQAQSNWGTQGAQMKNAIVGVTEGFVKALDIQGIGFKAAMEGNNLTLNLGFSHPVKFAAPEGIKFVVEKNIVKVSGIDKYLVGQTAAQIRKLKKPEPYQGKGIRYVGEVVRKKAGKKVAGATGGAA